MKYISKIGNLNQVRSEKILLILIPSSSLFITDDENLTNSQTSIMTSSATVHNKPFYLFNGSSFLECTNGSLIQHYV